MPVLLVLFGLVFGLGALLGRRRAAADKPRPPAWSDPRTPSDRLTPPRHHSEHHGPHHSADHDADDL